MKIKSTLTTVLVISLILGLFSPVMADACGAARQYMDRAKRLSKSAADLERKASLYGEAVRLSPKCAEAHNNLGDVYEKLGKFTKAIREYKETIKLAPNVPFPYFGLGDIHFKTNRYDDAISWYEKGLKYEPGDRLTLKRLALLKDIKKGGVIDSQTLVQLLTVTRGSGETPSVSFGEKLIPFDFNNAEIRADARMQLDEIGKALRVVLGEGESTRGIRVVRRKRAEFEIVGHTDVRGGSQYNMKLSLQRAENVVAYLVEQYGIPRGALKPVGLGEQHPLCGSDTESCHAMNRRVEIRRAAQ